MPESKTVEIKFDSSALTAMLGRLHDRVVPYIMATFRSFAQTGLEMVEERTPETHSGRTAIRDLWMLDDSGSSKSVAEFLIRNTYTPEKVIEFFEFGTRAHDIPVGRFGFLHFTTYEGDEVYTKKTVKHPGTRPYLMVTRTKWHLEVALDAYVAATVAMIERMATEGV